MIYAASRNGISRQETVRIVRASNALAAVVEVDIVHSRGTLTRGILARSLSSHRPGVNDMDQCAHLPLFRAWDHCAAGAWGAVAPRAHGVPSRRGRMRGHCVRRAGYALSQPRREAPAEGSIRQTGRTLGQWRSRFWT